MRILLVAYWFPYPPDNGARQRQMQIVRQLSRVHELVLLSYYDDDQQPVVEGLRQLAPYCEAVEVVTRRPYRGHDAAGVLDIARGRVPWITRRWNPEMSARCRRWLDGGHFDLLLLSHVENLPLLDEVPVSLPVILEQFEVGTIWDRPAERRGWAAGRAAASRALWAGYLRPRLARVDAITVAAESERRIAEQLTSGVGRRPRVVAVPNGADLASLPFGLAEPEPDRLIFQGALSYEPNLDAVHYFMKAIMPLIRRERPDVHLVVTGRPPKSQLLGAYNGRGLQLTGYVDDVRLEVSRSAACVVPARLGSGTKTKVLEAMALGTPVVATSKGITGLDVLPGVHALVADEPEAFARLTLQLLNDPQQRRELATAARALVEARYDYAEIVAALGHVCEEVAADRKKRA